MSVPMMFGRYLIMKGKITDQELNEALNVQSELNRSLAEELIERGHITLAGFREAWAYQREKFITFKEAVLELELVGREVIQEVEKACAGRHIKLGELLVQKGALTNDELISSLKEFKEGGYMKDL